MEIITGPERRRSWSEEQKRAIVAAAFAPGAIVADVAKAMDYMLKRWAAFTRFLSDGRICLTNNAAER